MTLNDPNLLGLDDFSRDLEMMTLESLAFERFVQGDLPASADAAERLLALGQSAGNDLQAGNAFLALARIAGEREDLQQAIHLLEQALAAYEKVSGADLRIANVCGLLGTTRVNIGDNPGALAAFQRMALASQKAQDPKMEALASQYLAGLYGLLPEGLEAAKQILKGNLETARRLGDPTLEVNTLTELGMQAAHDHDYPQAIEHWRQALEVLRRSPASALTGSLDGRLEAIGHNLLARAYANLGEDARALEHATTSLSLTQGQESPEHLLALDARAQVHFLAGRQPEAEADAREALDLLDAYRKKASPDELGRAGIQDLYSSLYELLQKVLTQQGKFEEALVAAEQGRARAFAEALAGMDDEPLPPLGSLEGVTIIEYSILHDPKRFLLPGRFEGLQTASEDELYVWVIRPAGDTDFRSVDLKTLGEALGAQVDRLSRILEGEDGPPEDPRDLLRSLYDVLIAPVANLLPADPNVPIVFIPQGSLFRLPFTALLNPEGRFLIETHTVLTAPSIASLAAFRPMGEKEGWTGPSALVVGDPVSTKLAHLSGAQREAREIARILDTQPLLGERATKAAVLAALPSARIIHVSAHGLLDRSETPNVPGALVLTPSSEGDDGLLTSGEIRDLELQADLVVLSACQTGRGRISSEGVFGLSRAFLAAGAAGVVMSLWRIDDTPTASLMIELHRRLKESGDPARALRMAILDALGRGESPSSWGAFLYMGPPALS